MNKKTYVALLRGINVGGKLVKMDELKKVFSSMGFDDVKTLLATGNVIFTAKETNMTVLNETISKSLKEKFGFEINVLMRTMKGIQELIAQDPFKDIIVKPETRCYVTFLSEKPKSSLIIPYENPEKDLKILSVTTHEVCTAITISEKRNTTDMMRMIEKEFGEKVTTRNWNTVKKIAAL